MRPYRVAPCRPGSSPLTRGKLTDSGGDETEFGLIPAHAGKTRSRWVGGCPRWAHPRSRGENASIGPPRPSGPGSSPLTRGKPEELQAWFEASRLIPAHAGKTSPLECPTASTRAHPRSRGENSLSSYTVSSAYGSSPLTRGKQASSQVRHLQERLIPAHAGKTARKRAETGADEAHPRSRGENSTSSASILTLHGSSPLTRGKRRRCTSRSASGRLIPAHAGKTWREEGRRPPTWAHPRSRGENPALQKCFHKTRGSSPLTRGKPMASSPGLSLPGLIPAHAGKTWSTHMCADATTAHPRSRGENGWYQSWRSRYHGSSPLTRGKLLQADGG